MRLYTSGLAAALVSVGVLAAHSAAAQAPAPRPPATQKPTARPPAGQAPTAKPPAQEGAEWWYLGKQEESDGDLLFIDAKTIEEVEKGDVFSFKGLYYYATPRRVTNNVSGERLTMAYEKYEAWLSCSERGLTDEVHEYFAADGKPVVFEEHYEDSLHLEPTPASDSVVAFFCGRERAGGSHKFERISGDPLSYARRK